MINHKDAFSEYIHSDNVAGSNKAASYILALDWLSKILEVEPLSFGDCQNIWSVSSMERLQELYLFVLEEARKKDASDWNLQGIPQSYLQNGYCSAALKAFIQYLSDISTDEVEEDIANVIQNSEISNTEKSTLINSRIGQGKFRKGLIEHWQGCAVTGYKDTRLLVASHIKPWRVSDSNQRLDPYNGLLLLPNLDKVFDLGYITFQEQGEIVISDMLESPKALGISLSMFLKIKPEHKEYMAFHRDEVFEKKLSH